MKLFDRFRRNKPAATVDEDRPLSEAERRLAERLLRDSRRRHAVVARESCDQLRQRFFRGNQQAATIASDVSRHDVKVRCPARPGMPVRIMTIREQLESLGAHNAYHFGRIVLLRQLAGAWPPPSGGFSW